MTLNVNVSPYENLDFCMSTSLWEAPDIIYGMRAVQSSHCTFCVCVCVFTFIPSPFFLKKKGIQKTEFSRSQVATVSDSKLQTVADHFTIVWLCSSSSDVAGKVYCC